MLETLTELMDQELAMTPGSRVTISGNRRSGKSTYLIHHIAHFLNRPGTQVVLHVPRKEAGVMYSSQLTDWGVKLSNNNLIIRHKDLDRNSLDGIDVFAEVLFAADLEGHNKMPRFPNNMAHASIVVDNTYEGDEQESRRLVIHEIIDRR